MRQIVLASLLLFSIPSFAKDIKLVYLNICFNTYAIGKVQNYQYLNKYLLYREDMIELGIIFKF